MRLLIWGSALWASLTSYSQTMVPRLVRNAAEPLTAAKVTSVPNFVLPSKYQDRAKYPLPPVHSNVKSPYFGPYDPKTVTGLWQQQGMSCGNAQSVSCVYNHEANKVRGTPTPAGANTPAFTYFYTFQFLNDGSMDGGDAWMFFEAFDILKETGGPSTEDFGLWQWGMAFGGWMSGYEKYYRAMKLRIDEYYDLNGIDPGADEAIKQILYDGADGSPIGTNLVFRAASGRNTVKDTIDGRPVMKVFNNSENHALSIVGWDDTFLPELGGTWIIHNTGGDGLWYVPRNQLKAGSKLNWPGIGVPVAFPRLKVGYSPQLTFKVTLTHNQRGNIAVMTGVGGPASTAPTAWKDYAGAFNYSGGLNPMVGRGQSSQLEFGLDLTDFAPYLKTPGSKLYFMVFSKGGTGSINSLSLMDYTQGAAVEIKATETGKPITAGTVAAPALTTIAISWNGTVAVRERAPEPPAIWRKAGSVRVRLTPEAATQATLDIRNVQGRSVFGSSMDLGSRSAGYLDLPWDKTDSRGRQVGPGLYFATVELRKGNRLVHSAVTRIQVGE